MITFGAEGGVVLSGRECQALAPVLRDAVERAEHNAGRCLPELEAIAGGVQRAAASYAVIRRGALAAHSLDRGTDVSRLDSGRPVSPLTNWITVSEAAGLIKVDPSYVRRLAARGCIRARQASRGTSWQVDRDDAEAWTTRRRGENHGAYADGPAA